MAEARVPRLMLWTVASLLVMAITAVAANRFYRERFRAPLPVLLTLPQFELTDQDGKRFGTDELRGHVFIANFIFTRCPNICPRFTGEMRGVQNRTRDLAGDLRLVSISVDPGYDQPPVLAKYAEKYGANTARWSFLTGDAEAVKATLLQGFKIAVGVNKDVPADDPNKLFHGTQFALVDRQLRVRGYYPSTEANALETLVRDARDLVDEASP